MKETLKTFLNRCRCCLNSFLEDESISPITEFFSIQFYAFTRLELQTDEQLSNHVCEYCHSELLRFSVFKKDLIEKQLKLYKMLKQKHKEPSIEDEVLDEDSCSENNLKQEEYEIDQMGSISENYSETESEDILEESEIDSKLEISTEQETTTNETDLLSCDYCQLKFRKKQGLIMHISSHIDEIKGNWGCDLCNFFTTTRLRLESHQKQCHTIDNIKGSVNKELESVTEKGSKKLVKTTTKSRIWKFRCFCGITFTKKSSVVKHRYRKHGSIKKCNYGCNINFTTIGEWIRHIRDIHPIHESECLKMVYASHKNIWYTEIRENDLKNENLGCLKCTFYALDKADLINHYQTMHPENIEGKVECPNCFKLFLSNNTLRMHIQTVHNSIRGFICMVCKAEFKQMGNLKEHVKKVHKIDYKPYSCPDCKETFALLTELKKHQQVVHVKLKKKILKRIENDLQCACNKIFKYASRLALHQKRCKQSKTIHHKVQSIEPHVNKCKVCSRTFVFKGNLTRHQRTMGHKNIK